MVKIDKMTAVEAAAEKLDACMAAAANGRRSQAYAERVCDVFHGALQTLRVALDDMPPGCDAVHYNLQTQLLDAERALQSARYVRDDAVEDAIALSRRANPADAALRRVEVDARRVD